MTKEREQFFENININDAAMARVVVEETRANIEKTNKGIKVGLVAMAIMLVLVIMPSGKDFLTLISSILQIAWFATLIMTYIWGGGFKQALSIGWKVAKVAWYVVPVFPWDIGIALGAGMLILMGYFFTPVIFVWLFKRQEEKDLAIAEEYLAQAQDVYYNQKASTNI